MKRLTLVAMVLAIPALSGCGLIQVSTNIPLFYSFSLEVVNASDYPVTLSANGEPLKFEFPDGRNTEYLKPGESTAIRIRNWNRQTASVTVIAKAWNVNDKLVGAIDRSFYVYGDYTQSDSWILRNDAFQNGQWWR